MEFDHWWLTLATVCLISALLGAMLVGSLLQAAWQQRQQPPPFEPPVLLPWRPTGRINAMHHKPLLNSNDDQPLPFHLLVEERRSVEDISGAALSELRWRYASKNEVKDIVRRYHRSIEAFEPARLRSIPPEA